MRRAGVLAVVACALALASAALAAGRPQAPPIAGATLTGGTASLAALRGKPVFVNVWSSW
jgi:hypothetical protein